MQQKLQQLIAEGKTAQVLAELRTLTAHDADLHQQVIALSARFAQHERQQHAGTLDNESLGLERNRINAALLALIAQLQSSPIDGVTQSHAVNTSKSVKPKNNWLKIGGLVAAIGLIASLAQISGYSLKDWFSKEDKKEIETTETTKPDTVVVILPLKEVVQEMPKIETAGTKPATTSPKNHFESKDQSKQVNIPDNKGTVNINQ